MYPVDRRRVASRIYSLLHSSRRTASLLQVSHTTVLRWLRNTERKKYKRSAPKTDILKECLREMVENDPSFTLRKAKATIEATIGVSVSHQLVRVVLKSLGYRRRKVRLHPRPTSTELATTASLESRYRYEAE
jgi:transposase